MNSFFEYSEDENQNHCFQSQTVVHASGSGLEDSGTRKKSKEQWRKVLGTFDIIKDHPSPSVNKRKAPKQSSARKSIAKSRKMPIFRDTSKRRSILSDSFTNKENDLEDSAIIWSSSNEESDDGSNKTTSKSSTDIASERSHPTNIQHETEINWSSSNGSDDEDISVQKNSSNVNQKAIDPEYELSLFVREIEKDLRRAKRIKQKFKNKTGGYVESFRKALNKAKSDEGFLEYEHRSQIICGSKGVIVDKEKTYGATFANVQLESGQNCCIFSGKNIQSSNCGSNVICFIDDSNHYKVNGRSIYIQPSNVIKA